MGEIGAAADKPIVQGRLAFSEGKGAVPLTSAGDGVLSSTLTVKEEAAYRVALVDADGLSSQGVEYFVRVMDDRPPVVHILRPSGDQQITPLDEVPIEARADDDFGIASLEMVYSVGGGPEKRGAFWPRSVRPASRRPACHRPQNGFFRSAASQGRAAARS